MTIGKRQHWEHGDTAMSGGLFSHNPPDIDDDKRVFLFVRGKLRIYGPRGETAYSKDWCKLTAEDIAYMFEYRKTEPLSAEELSTRLKEVA